MVTQDDGGGAAGEVSTAAVMVPRGLLDQEGMVAGICWSLVWSSEVQHGKYWDGRRRER